MMQAAIDLAAAGYPVFPCLEHNKAPACPHGFKDATNDPMQVADLFRRYPGTLIGVPTGEWSGINVLDLDPKNGCAKWWDINAARVPETRIHQTRSGGWHLLFLNRSEVRNSQSKIGPGVDTRGTGGYIIFWPACGGSIVSDAPIAPWPEWLVDAINHKPPQRVFTAPKTLKARNQIIERMIERALIRLQCAPAGSKHVHLRAAALTIGGLLDAAGMGVADALQALLAAVQQAGAEDMRNAEKTAAWGLQHGMATPFRLEVRHDGR